MLFWDDTIFEELKYSYQVEGYTYCIVVSYGSSHSGFWVALLLFSTLPSVVFFSQVADWTCNLYQDRRTASKFFVYGHSKLVVHFLSVSLL